MPKVVRPNIQLASMLRPGEIPASSGESAPIMISVCLSPKSGKDKLSPNENLSEASKMLDLVGRAQTSRHLTVVTQCPLLTSSLTSENSNLTCVGA